MKVEVMVGRVAIGTRSLLEHTLTLHSVLLFRGGAVCGKLLTAICPVYIVMY